MKKILIPILILVLLSGCSKKDAVMDKGKNYSKEESSGTSDISTNDGKIKTDDLTKKTIDEKSADSKSQPKSEDIQRQLIRTGTISYNVSDLKDIENNVGIKVKEFGGYVFSSNYTLNSITMQVKIPYDKFENFLMIAGNFGKITSKTINVEDVTMQYYDLENQIKNRRILQQRFQSYLSTAKNVEDLMKVETELNRVTEEVESLEGQFKNLSHLISYSTLTLNFYIPGTDEVVRNFPSLKNGFTDFAYAVVNFLFVLLFIVLGIIFFGVPIIFIIGILYYLSFGKVGLVKKLFSTLSGKKQM